MPIIANTRIGRLKSTTSLSVLSVLCLGLCSATLHGQTRFQVHDTTPALPRYLSAEECLAAVSRTSDSVARARPVFPDTMPFKKGEGRESIVAPAVAIARQCSAKFHPDSVSITGYVESYADWMQLYLLANRDDAADVVAQRRITNARQQPKSPQEMYDVLIGAMTVYGNVRPMRWEKIKATRVQIEAPGVAPDPIALYRAYFLQYRFAETFGDTVVQTDLAERMVAMAKMAPPEIKNSRDFVMVRYVTFMLTSFLTRAERMDSLAAGPGSYVALSRAQWQKIAEESKLPIPQMIGEQAAAVTAEFWFTPNNGPNNATNADAGGGAQTDQTDFVRPSPGKVALVVFMRQGCNAKISSFFGLLDRGTYWGPCWSTYATLRRFGQRFPWLEITIVARTAGYIGDTGLMSPQDEALVLQKWWLGFHRLPATLAVTNTPFFRVEGLDRRRVDHPVTNDVNYLFGQGGEWNEVRSQTAYLIDTNGMILFSEQLGAWTDQIITEMLEAIEPRMK